MTLKKQDGLTVPKKNAVSECHCISCNSNYIATSFYLSNSIITRGNANRMAVCKRCVEELFNLLVDKYDNCKSAQYRMCQMLDIYFDSNLYDSAEKQARDTQTNICKIYMQKINSLPQYRNKIFADSPTFRKEMEDSMHESIFRSEKDASDDDKKNMEDVLMLLGYDPFQSENEDDKRFLYNTLNGYLDEEILQDGFKISSIIEIVKSFNQLEAINRTIAQVTESKEALAVSHGQLKSLIDSKTNLSRQINLFAKENGVGSSNSKNQSRGANTLSGILKELRDKSIRESDVNLFNIRTCDAFKQIADLSNRSITEQLQFDENDFSEMINQQRDMILRLQEETDKIREENRYLRVELKKEEREDDISDKKYPSYD